MSTNHIAAILVILFGCLLVGAILGTGEPPPTNAGSFIVTVLLGIGMIVMFSIGLMITSR